MIRPSTNPTYKDLLDRLLDLQGQRGNSVLSVQSGTGGMIYVGIREQFKTPVEFRNYLMKNGLPFQSVGQNKWGNYIMKKDEVTAEFYVRDF